MVARQYYSVPFYSDCVSEKILREQIPLIFPETTENEDEQVHRVLSLFSGCGGMDLGFEGHFIANKKSFPSNDSRIDCDLNDNWILLKKNNLNLRMSLRTFLYESLLRQKLRHKYKHFPILSYGQI